MKFLSFFAAVLEFAEKYWIYGLGFFSQGIFGVRMLIQWYLSEKEGRIVSPLIFWQLSLIAGFLFLVYGILQNDFVILLGQALAYVISVRNLQLEGSWKKMPFFFRAGTILFPLIAMAWMFLRTTNVNNDFQWNDLLSPLVFVGAIGQVLLSFRFLYQWYFAEKTKTTDLPIGFWIMTTVGSILVVIYAVFHFDPVLLFAQGLGLFASVRNIQLHYKSREAE